jgi:hypothetical protein
VAETINQHQTSTFVTPVNGTTADATVVLGNDNAIGNVHNAHDADPGIHVQSGTHASRPAASAVGRKWLETDTLRLYYDTGAAWSEISYVPIISGAVSIAALTLTSSPLNFTAAGPFVFGTTDNNTVTVKTNQLTRWQVDTSGNLLSDTTNGGTVQDRLASGLGLSKMTRMLRHNGGLSTTNAGTTTVDSFVLKANSLDTNGQGLRFVVSGRTSGTTSGASSIIFGGTLVGGTITNPGSFFYIIDLVRTGASAELYNNLHIDGTAVAISNATLAIALNADITVGVTGQTGGAGTVFIDTWSAEYLAT